MDTTASKPKAATGHVVLLLALAGWLLWYAWDTWSASATVNNLVLIVPAALVGLGLIVALLVGELRNSRRAASDPSSEAAKDAASEEVRISLILIALLAGYVGTMNWIGLDIATFLFIAASLVALDERRIAVICAFSAGFTVITLGAMGQLILLPEAVFLGWLLK